MTVSVCIPSNNQPLFLLRALESIAMQTYKLIQVVVSDDSTDNACRLVCEKFSNRVDLTYWKNQSSLGSPANWNQALALANGDYSLLLHHDDELYDETTISRIVDYLIATDRPDVLFSGSVDFDQDGVRLPKRQLTKRQFIRFLKRPESVFGENLLGNPSTVCFRTCLAVQFDSRFKWVVDEEFYYRLFSLGYVCRYLPAITIKINRGIHQVTNECLVRDIDLKESVDFYFLLKPKDRGWRPRLKLVRKMASYQVVTQSEVDSMPISDEGKILLGSLLIGARIYAWVKAFFGRGR